MAINSHPNIKFRSNQIIAAKFYFLKSSPFFNLLIFKKKKVFHIKENLDIF